LNSRNTRRVAAVAAGAAAALLTIVGVLVAPASAAGTASATFTKTQDWGGGFEGRVDISNGGTASLNWSLAFDLPSGYSISSAWDATMASSGQHYTFTPPSW